MGANALGTWGSAVLAGISALVVTPIVIHHLGREAFGAYSLLAQVSSYLILLNLGFGTATVKLVAEDAGRDDARVVAMFNTSFFALCLLALVAALAGCLTGLVAPSIFHIPQSLHTASVISFEVLAVTFAASVPATAVIGVVMGYQRYDLQGVVDCIGIVALGVAMVVVVEAGGGLVGVSAAVAGGTLLMAVAPWWVAKHLVPGLRLSPRLLDRARFREVTVLSSFYLLRNLSMTLNNETDLLVVGAVLNLRDVGLFAIALQLSLLGDKAVSPFQRIFFPHVSSLSAASADGSGQLQAVFDDGTRTAMAVATPFALVLMLLAAPAIRAWVGPGFGGATTALVILAAAGLLRTVTTVADQILEGLGRARASAAIGMTTAVVNLICSVALALAAGLPGVALGSLVAVVVVQVPATLVVTVRGVGLSLRGWLRTALAPQLPASAAAIVVLVAARSLVATHRFATIGTAVVACALYWGVFLAFGATPEEKTRMATVLRRAR